MPAYYRCYDGCSLNFLGHMAILKVEDGVLCLVTMAEQFMAIDTRQAPVVMAFYIQTYTDSHRSSFSRDLVIICCFIQAL